MNKVFVPYNDENNGGVLTILAPAKLLKIPVANRTTNDDKATPYGIATALVTYPDDSTEEVQALMWGGSIDTGLFEEGQDIVLRTQLEGEYAGNSVVQLPGSTKVDITKFAGLMANAPEKGVEANA